MVSHFVLPLILALTFASIVWLISSIVYDSKYDEKPTIEEVLYTLHNITIRFEMIFRPIKKFPFTITNYTRLFVVTVLLSPVYWLLVKTIIPPQKFLWYSGLFALTFHSPTHMQLDSCSGDQYISDLLLFTLLIRCKGNQEVQSK